MESFIDRSVVYTFGAAIIGFSWFCYLYQVDKHEKILKRKKRPAKKKEFALPKWAIKKAKELKPQELTSEQLELLHLRKPLEIWNNVIIFPDPLPSRDNSPTKQLLRYFKEARTSIYLCMYLCSNYTMSNVIRDKFEEGLVVNCVSEYDTWTAHNNKGIKDLAHHGIDVRLNRNGFMMHNKFAIIDEEAVITGSLNWTRQGVESNCENVIITIDPRIVSKYLQEFNKLFNACRRWDVEVKQ